MNINQQNPTKNPTNDVPVSNTAMRLYGLGITSRESEPKRFVTIYKHDKARLIAEDP